MFCWFNIVFTLYLKKVCFFAVVVAVITSSSQLSLVFISFAAAASVLEVASMRADKATDVLLHIDLT